jgi:hypothetical protein
VTQIGFSINRKISTKTSSTTIESDKAVLHDNPGAWTEEANEMDPLLAAIDALIPNMQSLENKFWQDGPILSADPGASQWSLVLDKKGHPNIIHQPRKQTCLI